MSLPRSRASATAFIGFALEVAFVIVGGGDLRLPTSVTLVVGGLLLLGAFLTFRQRSNARTSLMTLLILSIPLSYRTVTGSAYGESIASWFNLVLLLLAMVVMTGMLRMQFSRRQLPILGLAAWPIWLAPALMVSSSFADAAKQYVNIVGFACIVLASLVGGWSQRGRDVLRRAFLASASATALLLVIAWVLWQHVGIAVGRVLVLGGQRIAFSLYYPDPSFMSLYMASAAALAAGDVRSRDGVVPRVILTAFLSCASIITSARTGMVALVLALFLTYAISRHTFTRPGRSLVNVLMVVLVAAAVWTAFSVVRPLDATEDSGRIAGYALAMSQFASHPLLGIGLGVEEYRLVSGSTIPHNLLFQLLAQTGLYGTIGMLGSLLAVLLTLWRYDSRHALVLLTCLIGGLFIPDLLNSRFVPVLLSLSAASLMDPVLPRTKVGWAR